MNPQRYDDSLQMFVQEATEPNGERLAFMRWLGEQGRLEHEVAGDPSGPYAEWVGKPEVLDHAA